MKYVIKLVFFVSTVLWFYTCSNTPNFSNIPELTFVGFSKSTLNQGSVDDDSLTLIVDFRDGDGDIGSGERNNDINLIIIDSRTNRNYASFKVPAIPEKGANNGVEGRMFINLYNSCCIIPDAPPCSVVSGFNENKISFEVFLIDRAKNKSNTLKTPEITMLCN